MAAKNQMHNGQSNTASGKLRIIAGEWRSRILPVVDLPGLRPTADRVRETLFNWLQNDISGARCLDLFAGTGALGFEAASRGCAAVLMLELQGLAVKNLQKNIHSLQSEKVQLLHQDAVDWLTKSTPQVFDIVFLDPPFASDYLQTVCQLLEQRQFLAEFACIYLETASDKPLPELADNWTVTKQKKSAQVSYYLIRRNFVAE